MRGIVAAAVAAALAACALLLPSCASGEATVLPLAGGEAAVQNSHESVWVGWNEQTAGLASAWWRDEILANSAIAAVYAQGSVEKSAS